MFYKATILLIFAFAISFAPAQCASDDAVLARLTVDWRNAVMAKDHIALHRLMSPNFVLEGPAFRGPVPLDKWLDNLYRHFRITSYKHDNIIAHAYGAVGVVTSTFSWRGTYKGRTFDQSGVVADTWTRKNGTWRVARRISYLTFKKPGASR